MFDEREYQKRYRLEHRDKLLTCWLCFKPIIGESGQPEHDLEPCRGGLNVKGNLGVAHASCNRSKGVRTRAEYWEQEGICPKVI